MKNIEDINKEAIKINYIMILAFIFIAVSTPIYYFIGSPQSISILESESQIDRTIEMLNVRLSEDPEDLDALRALANSYVLKNSLENAFLSKFSVSVSITDVLLSCRSWIGKRYLSESRDSFTFPTWQSSLADFGKKDLAISHE